MSNARNGFGLFTCEYCGMTFEHQDQGHVHPETGEWECDSCYYRYMLTPIDSIEMYRNDPHVSAAKKDQARFYINCKDNPEKLHYT